MSTVQCLPRTERHRYRNIINTRDFYLIALMIELPLLTIKCYFNPQHVLIAYWIKRSSRTISLYNREQVDKSTNTISNTG